MCYEDGPPGPASGVHRPRLRLGRRPRVGYRGSGLPLHVQRGLLQVPRGFASSRPSRPSLKRLLRVHVCSCCAFGARRCGTRRLRWTRPKRRGTRSLVRLVWLCQQQAVRPAGWRAPGDLRAPSHRGHRVGAVLSLLCARVGCGSRTRGPRKLRSRKFEKSSFKKQVKSQWAHEDAEAAIGRGTCTCSPRGLPCPLSSPCACHGKRDLRKSHAHGPVRRMFRLAAVCLCFMVAGAGWPDVILSPSARSSLLLVVFLLRCVLQVGTSWIAVQRCLCLAQVTPTTSWTILSCSSVRTWTILLVMPVVSVPIVGALRPTDVVLDSFRGGLALSVQNVTHKCNVGCGLRILSGMTCFGSAEWVKRLIQAWGPGYQGSQTEGHSQAHHTRGDIKKVCNDSSSGWPCSAATGPPSFQG